MMRLLAVMGVVSLSAQLCSCAQSYSQAQSQYPRYLKFPVGRDPDTECMDYQVNKRFKVGEVWTSRYSGCKQSHCIREKGVLYIDRLQCPSVQDKVDYKRLKADNLFCREARGDRRKPFPDCCARLVCKYYFNGKLVPLPLHKYPYL
ncbi:uncharacterized protein LOC122381172 [Amphibalanus amphitrite]|uniref:uncharacterized protein LOC122381172 n=1 Tax=Amphibalanus amphitrite TaxID=1232801 RepID=UPI001C912DBD|nr:uncharacterized protein LOC122381172 [Amphibalanus amphitrite]